MIESSLHTQAGTRRYVGKQRFANLTSNIINPFLICMGIILLFSFRSVASFSEGLKWAAIALSVSVVPVFLLIFSLFKRGKVDSMFTNIREQRTKIYATAGLSAVGGRLLLSYMGAPKLLVGCFDAVLITALVFLLINLWWKISVHTACVAASSIMLVMLYGWSAAVTVALVPLTAWARVELEHHSVAQTVSGAVVAAAIAVLIFKPLIDL